MKINAVRPQDNIFTNQLASIAKVPNTLYYCGELPSTPVKSVANLPPMVNLLLKKSCTLLPNITLPL